METAYASMSDAALCDLLFSEEDRLSRVVVDEFLRRGARIAPRLIEILDDDDAWEEELPGFWAPVHAAYILAAMKPEGAVEALVRALDNADVHDVEWIFDPVRWLLASFGPSALAHLRTVATDRAVREYVRIWVSEGVAGIGQAHAGCREEAASVLRSIVRDASSPPDVRTFAARELLDFLIPDDRELLLKAADGEIFAREDVERHFQRGHADLREPLDWLSFYDESKIQQRQAQWAQEDDHAHSPDAGDAVDNEVALFGKNDDVSAAVRDVLDAAESVPGQLQAVSKVGRNDPCPCDSGKKFKKCCGK